MENYNKTLRDKKDLEKKVKMFRRENKSQMNQLKLEKCEIESGLLDLQSKTINLNDTMSYIASILREEKVSVKNQLKEIQVKKEKVKSRPPLNQYQRLPRILPPRGVSLTSNPYYQINKRENIHLEALKKEGISLVNKLQQIETRLRWINEENSKGTNAQTALLLLNQTKGFKLLLNKIRQRKAEHEIREAALCSISDAEPEATPRLEQAENLCQLIDGFHHLPKIYPTKPTKKKRKVSEVLLQQYQQRREERERAMNYGTRTRLRRAQYHCDSLKQLYVAPKATV